ncbi:hypothetical protein [Bdellovibrio svalbardensis]|uniref:Uncharacterized protein n=1 Tax=Bdellovibrio svalbardensis TaxID=2972972 RepID=A0ABT6DHX7_9BACT|nr:hypothetical protein [Bdellovibrio svalbardensis]MDG0816432.1 hypothetical protein [Bdellovibrio svalbardensis]
MTSKTNKQIATTIGVFGLAIFIAILWWNLYGVKYVEKAKESELRTIMASVVTAERAYFEEYKKFSSDLKAIGYSAEGNLRSTIYLKPEDIPVGLREELSESDIPFVRDDDYQILGVLKDNHRISFWTQRKGDEPKKVKSVQPH